MNQEKIGKFIAQLRKEKNMTQNELANRLGITDRAISKWENGRGMPDLSLIKDLCKELDITINELLSGEKISKQDYQNKFEENMLNTIDYSNEKIKKDRKKLVIIFGTIGIVFLSIILAYFVDINRMRNNKPVLFNTWGLDYVSPIDLSSEKIELAITEYLVSRNDLESEKYNDEKWFVSFKTYLIEEKKNKKLYNVYAWVLEKSFYLKNDVITEDSGSSIPYLFVVERDDDNYKVKDSRIPRDGSLYSDDMKNIFPYSIRNDMNKVHIDGTIEMLNLDIKQQAKLYFYK